jgi:phage baseplate assembly protein W
MSVSSGKHLSFPFRIGQDGRAAAVASDDEHVRDELVQLLLTNLGERLFLPEFGGGVRRMVFESIDETTRGVTMAMLTDAVSRWLGHRLTLEALDVDVREETIEIEIKYRPAGADDSKSVRLRHEGGPL